MTASCSYCGRVFHTEDRDRELCDECLQAYGILRKIMERVIAEKETGNGN